MMEIYPVCSLCKTPLEFLVHSWSPWTKADKECLEKVQRRAVGMVSGLAARDYEERLRDLGHTTLEDRMQAPAEHAAGPQDPGWQ